MKTKGPKGTGIIQHKLSVGKIMKKIDQIHAVLVPWSAFGHIMPMLHLSIALAKVGVHASLVSTPRNIQRLPKLPPDVPSLVDLVELPLPAVDGNLLPEGAEATVDIPFEKIQYLKVAHDLLKNPFKEFIADQSPDWIISDLLTHWVAEVGQEMDVPVVSFYAFSAASTVFFGPPEHLDGEGRKRVRPSPESMTTKPPWVNFPSTVAYRKHEAIPTYAGFYSEDVSGLSTAQRVDKVVLACKAVAIHSCLEFETENFNLQEKISGKPAIPVGFLPPGKPASKNASSNDEAWNNIFKWLDEQKPRSVVFVGFGSECKLTKGEIHEIAYGLELSGVTFLWALQKQSWATNDSSDGCDALPTDFSSRVCGKGAVKMGWAPQMEILGHPSVGGCLFRAGWGSVIESFQYGHCLVVLPFIIDQGLNARLLVEKGLAIEVDRSEDGSFTKDGIADSLRRAMALSNDDQGKALSNDDQGKALRARAEEAAAVFGDQKLNDGYIGFVQYMKNNGLKK